MRRMLLIAILLLAGPSFADETVTYRGYVPTYLQLQAKREFPKEETLADTKETCVFSYGARSFAEYRFQEEAIEKEKRFGKGALDQHDIAWIMSMESRKRACLGLLYRANLLSWWDTLVFWWSGR